MATINQLMMRIEKRLFLAAGIDVQVHAEDQIIEMIRGIYDTLFDDFWYPEYTYEMTSDLDGTTGHIVDNISNKVRRFKDIHTVYYNQDDRPLPLIKPGTSVDRTRTRGILPSANTEKVFTMVPRDTQGPLHFWYRTKLPDSVWEDLQFDTEIPFDDNVLLYGAVYEFLVMDGSNDKAAGEYQVKYKGRQQQMRDAQWLIPISKRKMERDGPLTRWE